MNPTFPVHSAGESRTEVVLLDLTRTRLVMYAGASGDFNPIHTDEVYATQAAGQPTVFAHGMLTMAAAMTVITDWVGTSQLTRTGARFLGLVRPGDTVRATATIEAVQSDEAGGSVIEFSLLAVNQDDTPVLSGYATARLGAAPQIP